MNQRTCLFVRVAGIRAKHYVPTVSWHRPVRSLKGIPRTYDFLISLFLLTIDLKLSSGYTFV